VDIRLSPHDRAALETFVADNRAPAGGSPAAGDSGWRLSDAQATASSIHVRDAIRAMETEAADPPGSRDEGWTVPAGEYPGWAGDSPAPVDIAPGDGRGAEGQSPQRRLADAADGLHEAVVQRWDTLRTTGPTATAISVGTEDILAGLTGAFVVFDRQGNRLTGDTPINFDTWFRNVVPAGASDYRVHSPGALYDYYQNRHVLLAYGQDGTDSMAHLMLSVSKTSEASGESCIFRINARTHGTRDDDIILDMPRVGQSSDAILVTANTWNRADRTFRGARLWVLPKETYFNVSCPSGFRWWTFDLLKYEDDRPAFGLAPAVSLNDLPLGYVLSARLDNGGEVVGWPVVTNGTGEPSLLGPFTIWGSFGRPPLARQRGTTTPIFLGDERLSNAVFIGNRLWTAHPVSCRWPGDSIERSCIEWYEFLAVPFSLRREDRFGLERHHLGAPAITADIYGNVVVVYNDVGPEGQFLSLEYSLHRNASIASAGETVVGGVLREGQGCFDTPSRYLDGAFWGINQAIAYDPLPAGADNGMLLWPHGAYLADSGADCLANRWNGTIAAIDPENPHLPAGGISGDVTFEGQPAPDDEPIFLLRTNDARDTVYVMDVTFTDGGRYQFGGLPTLPATDDQGYYVAFSNSSGRDNRFLYYWECFPVLGYRAGQDVRGCAFDLADIALGPPDDDRMPRSLPIEFQWTPRRGVRGDSYFVRWFDDAGNRVQSNELGAVGRYMLNFPLSLGSERIRWDVGVRSASGFGIASGLNVVWIRPSFTNNARRAIMPALLRSHDFGRVFVPTATPPPPAVALRDGNFDTGRLGAWRAGGELGAAVVNEAYQRRPLTSPSGAFAVRLGNDRLHPSERPRGNTERFQTGSGWIEQAFTIPNTPAPRLSFRWRMFTWDHVQNAAGFRFDALVVSLHDGRIEAATELWREGNREGPSGLPSIDPNQRIRDLGWRQASIALPDRFRGQTMVLRFASWNDEDEYLKGNRDRGAYNTFTYVDDVAVVP